MIAEDAQRLRKMSESSRKSHRAAVLLLASQTLSDLSYYVMLGRVPSELIVRLESLERLFKLYGLPASILARYKRLARKLAVPGHLVWPTGVGAHSAVKAIY
jgi:hypothetical protein